MIVVSANMLTGNTPRLNLVTSSSDYLASVDYPLRPSVHRTWGKQHQHRSRWHCCYFPKSFPVYRMHRMLSLVLCLLFMVLLSVIGFVLMNVMPPQQMLKNRPVPPADLIQSGISRDGKIRKLDSDLGLVRTARKLEDHAEYRRSAGGGYSEGDNYDDDDDDDNNDSYANDELILSNYGDQDYDDEQDYNPVFDMRYFDFSMKLKEGDFNQGKMSKSDDSNEKIYPAFITPNIREKWRNLPKVKLENDFEINVIEDGVVFSQHVETLLPEPTISDTKIGQVQYKLRSGDVTALQEPTWERCGRPKNQWLKMSSGDAACARYRYPDDYLLVGEVLSFYLSRVLSVGHVPPVVLSQPSGPRWQKVEGEMKRAGWGEAPLVVLTPWLPALERDHMPSILLDAIMENATLSAIMKELGSVSSQTFERDLKESRKEGDLRPINVHQKKVSRSGNAAIGLNRIRELSERDLTQLLQWSDLLVFDYLTGNYDRVAYMQDAAEKEGLLKVLSGTIHNLVKSKDTDALWLLDNESGMIDAYTLLYSNTAAEPAQSSRFYLFHKQMLQSMCIFRRSTMEAVLGLHTHPMPHVFLVDFVRRQEPLFHLLPDPLQNSLFVKYFSVRLKEVYEWISSCINIVQGHSANR